MAAISALESAFLAVASVWLLDFSSFFFFLSTSAWILAASSAFFFTSFLTDASLALCLMASLFKAFSWAEISVLAASTPVCPSFFKFYELIFEVDLKLKKNNIILLLDPLRVFSEVFVAKFNRFNYRLDILTSSTKGEINKNHEHDA